MHSDMRARFEECSDGRDVVRLVSTRHFLSLSLVVAHHSSGQSMLFVGVLPRVRADTKSYGPKMTTAITPNRIDIGMGKRRPTLLRQPCVSFTSESVGHCGRTLRGAFCVPVSGSVGFTPHGDEYATAWTPIQAQYPQARIPNSSGTYRADPIGVYPVNNCHLGMPNCATRGQVRA